jgi:hypothetical protein
MENFFSFAYEPLLHLENRAVGMAIWLYVFIGFVGLAVGSFLNVCIYRIPREESLTKKASHCTTCGA